MLECNLGAQCGMGRTLLSRMRMRLPHARNFLEKGLAPDYVFISPESLLSVRRYAV